MSRGHGRVERAILAAIPPYPGGPAITRWSLAQQIYGVEVPTRAQRASVDRAVNNLIRQGLAANGRFDVVVHTGPWISKSRWYYHGCEGENCRWCEQAIDPAVSGDLGLTWGFGPVDERGRHREYWRRETRSPRITQPYTCEQLDQEHREHVERLAEARRLRGVS